MIKSQLTSWRTGQMEIEEFFYKSFTRKTIGIEFTGANCCKLIIVLFIRSISRFLDREKYLTSQIRLRTEYLIPSLFDTLCWLKYLVFVGRRQRYRPNTICRWFDSGLRFVEPCNWTTWAGKEEPITATFWHWTNIFSRRHYYVGCTPLSHRFWEVTCSRW